MASGNSAATVLTAIHKLRQVEQAVAVPADDVVDDGSGLGDDPIGFGDHGRLAERVDLAQLHRRQIGARVALVERDAPPSTRCARSGFDTHRGWLLRRVKD